MTDQDPLGLLAKSARNAKSSVIRDLLEHAKRPGVISMAGGIPDSDLFPVAQIAETTAVVLGRNRDVLQYGLTSGELSARLAVAPLLGHEPDPERVIVTTGSQQGLDLLAKVTVDPGDVVVTGDPSYLGALQAFRSHQADIRAVDVDEAGLVVEQMEELLRGGMRPSFVYVVANFQNPTGVVLSEPRRVALTGLAEQYGFLIIEDDPYGELRYEGHAVAPIGPGSDHVVRLRSTSKVLAPGLRVGWTEGPSWLIDAMVVAKQSADLHTSTLSQAIVTELLTDRFWFAAHLDTIRDQYRERRDGLVAALDAGLGRRCVFQRPEGGMFLWVTFPGVNTSALLTRALECGVAFVPAGAFVVNHQRDETARLSFASVDPEDFDEAVERLARAIDTC
jgi:2-aminoadipate transaminase